MSGDIIEGIRIALLIMLIIAAVAASVMKKLVPALIVFTSFSLIMALLWILLESSDLAITEAAVGAGVSGVLFYMAIHRMGQMKEKFEDKEGGAGDEKGEESAKDAAGDGEVKRDGGEQH